MNEILKKNKLRRMFKEKGFRIGNNALKRLVSKIEDDLVINIEKAKRNALISGRKTIKTEDFEQ